MAVELRCPSCAAGVVPGDRFCEACGTELPAEAPAPPPPPPVAVACTECGATDGLDGYCAHCGARLPRVGDHREVDLGGVAGVSDRGRRPVNEDAMAVSVADGLVAAVVCDGVSATPGSDRVAQAAADAAAVSLAGDPSEDGHLAAYAAARAAALAVAVPVTPAGPPSCTYLAASVTDSAVVVGSLGDCRAYWLDGHGIRQLTADHSWAAEEIAAGRLSGDQAYADRRAHSITRWIGADADPAWAPDVAAFRPPGPGRLVLCSDGVWMYALDPVALATVTAGPGGAADVARRLVDHADRSGGADNITAVVVDVPPALAPAGADRAPAAPDPPIADQGDPPT